MSKRRSKAQRGKSNASRPAKSKAAIADAPLSPDAGLLRVALWFFVIYAVLQTTAWYLAFTGYFDSLLEAMASLTGACSNVTGVPATVAGNEIFLATRILRIDLDCTGISLMLIYTALVLAYPLSIKRKLIGLAIGLPVIAVANLIRLTVVAQLSGPLGDKAFLFVHDYLFKVLMMGVVIVLWGLYLASAKRNAS